MTEQNPQQQQAQQQQQQQQAQPQQQQQAQPQQQQPQPQQPAQPVESTNAYQGIIEQQQEQINALLEQTKSLNAQIVSMVANGAQFSQAQPQPAQPALPTQQVQYQPFTQPAYNPMSLAQDSQDWTLEALAKEIGRKDV